MRIVAVGHTYSAIANHGKIRAAARECRIAVMAPVRWNDEIVSSELSQEANKTMQVWPTKTIGSRFGNRYAYVPSSALTRLKAFSPHIIHVEEEPGSIVALEFALLSKLVRAKFTLFTWENRVPMAKLPAMEHFVLGSAAGIIAGNSGARKLLRQKGYFGRSPIIPQLGVDGTTLAAPKENRRCTVGYVGRFITEKGIGDLCEATRDLPDVDVHLLGGGQLEAELRAEATSPIWGGRLRVFDSVPHSEVPAFLRSLSMLVLPSRTAHLWTEQFGHVLIEAMALGVPCIGSTSGAIPEVIGDAGLLVPEGDVGELRRAILMLYRDKTLRESLARRGRRRVERLFTDEVIARRTVAFWKRVLADD